MKPRPPWFGGSFAAVLLLGVLSPVRAQEEPREDLAAKRKEVISQRWKVLELQARNDVLEEVKKLFANPPAAKEDALEDQEGWAPLLRETLEEAHQDRLRVLKEQKEKLTQKRKKAEDAWRTALDEKLRFVDEEMAAQARYGLPRVEGNEPSWWDLGTVAIVIWGVILCLVSLALGLHGQRRQLRSRARFKKKLALAALPLALLALPLPSFLWAQAKAGGDWVEKERAGLTKQLKDLKEEERKLSADFKKLELSVDHNRETALQHWLALFPGKDEEKGSRKKLWANEEKVFAELRDLLRGSEVVKRASKEGEQFFKDLSEHQEALSALIEREESQYRVRGTTKAGLCLGFILLAFVPLHFLERSRRRTQWDQAEQCPCCLRKGSLKVKTEVRDTRFPEMRYLECEGTPEEEGCHYQFRASYQKLPRFCFPTVGIRGSGKTHWLVTAYDLIKNHRVHLTSAIQTAPSLADEEFEALIEEILESHKNARPTVQMLSQVPHPLIFHLRDADPLGKNAGMLNLFDFSGEMMAHRINISQLRQRALVMEGFVLFLDPTQVTKKKGVAFALKDQVQALAAFHEEMRDMRGLDVGTPIPVPIAVCISKLDLIVNQNPFGGAALPWIQQLQDSFVRPLSRAAIYKRSELCAQAVDVLFPGWNLVRTLEENFGGRFLFFPMTPVSLERGELGQTDLTRRTFAPVGILEPILWLLHMHGFAILP